MSDVMALRPLWVSSKCYFEITGSCYSPICIRDVKVNFGNGFNVSRLSVQRKGLISYNRKVYVPVSPVCRLVLGN